MSASAASPPSKLANVSGVTYTGTGTKDGVVTVTFTYTGTTTTNGIAEIYYGLYVAKPEEVPDQGAGPTDGANAWTGGSLQTTVDIGGSGATSIQLAPAAIIAGEISGMKFNDLDGDGIHDVGEPGLANWTITLDTDSDSTNGYLAQDMTDVLGNYSFSVTPDADKADPDNDPYYVYEVSQPGWLQTAPSTGFYGPLTVTSLTPQYLNQDFGNIEAAPQIVIDKVTVDGTASGDNLIILSGESISWTYMVTNAGNVALSNASVIDNVLGVTPVYASGDTDSDSLLDLTETWVFQASGTAVVGPYSNIGTATGSYLGGTVSDTDPSGYFGANPQIDVEKYVSIDGGTTWVDADDSSTDGLDEIPVAGQHLIIKNSAGTTMGDAYTDEDGWYFAQFLATGKQSTYRVYWDDEDDGNITGDAYHETPMGGAAGKWVYVDFTVVDPVGYDAAATPTPDYQIDDYSALL